MSARLQVKQGYSLGPLCRRTHTTSVQASWHCFFLALKQSKWCGTEPSGHGGQCWPLSHLQQDGYSSLCCTLSGVFLRWGKTKKDHSIFQLLTIIFILLGQTKVPWVTLLLWLHWVTAMVWKVIQHCVAFTFFALVKCKCRNLNLNEIC